MEKLSPKQNQSIHRAVWLAGLTNYELKLIKLWMDGFRQFEIKKILCLDISQPAISKQIKNIQARIQRSYYGIETIVNENK